MGPSSTPHGLTNRYCLAGEAADIRDRRSRGEWSATATRSLADLRSLKLSKPTQSRRRWTRRATPGQVCCPLPAIFQIQSLIDMQDA
jgi:hypothetical protein